MKIQMMIAVTMLNGMVSAKELKTFASEDRGFGKSMESYIDSHTDFSWKEGVSTAKGLELFDKPVLHLELEEKEEKVVGLHFMLGKLEKGGSVSYNSWGKVLQAGLGDKAKSMKAVHVAGVKRVRVAWNLDDCVSVYEKRSTFGVPDELWLSVYEKKAGYAYLAKSGYIGGGKKTPRGGGGDVKEIQKEQTATIKEIMARKPGSGISKASQDAVNLLNVYRYLCKVPYNVQSSKKLNDNAIEAATACKKVNKLSHDLGSYTDKCNLAMSTGGITMESSVTQYIDDRGDNNRVRRGHRRWCLNHPMGKAGFGLNGYFSAMYCFDVSGSKGRDNYGYPGIGAFPLKYLHGNAWSYYSMEGNFPDKCEVEVYRLKKYAKKPPVWSDEPEGRKLPVPYISPSKWSLNFEPQNEPVTKKGTYLVRIKGGSIKDQYLVHLY